MCNVFNLKQTIMSITVWDSTVSWVYVWDQLITWGGGSRWNYAKTLVNAAWDTYNVISTYTEGNLLHYLSASDSEYLYSLLVIYKSSREIQLVLWVYDKANNIIKNANVSWSIDSALASNQRITLYRSWDFIYTSNFTRYSNTFYKFYLTTWSWEFISSFPWYETALSTSTRTVAGNSPWSIQTTTVSDWDLWMYIYSSWSWSTSTNYQGYRLTMTKV